MIDAEAARAATQEILRLHSIPAQVSKDMQDLLAAAPAGAGGGAAAAEASPAAEAAAEAAVAPA